jgi:hypothetical protein
MVGRRVEVVYNPTHGTAVDLVGKIRIGASCLSLPLPLGEESTIMPLNVPRDTNYSHVQNVCGAGIFLC